MVCRCRKIGCFYVIAILLFSSCGNDHTEKRNIAVTLKEGDIVFRCGHGATSRAVLMMNTNGLYSHVGVAILQNDSIFIIHEVPGESSGKNEEVDVIRCEPLQAFFQPYNASKGAIYRTDIDKNSRQKIVEYLRLQLKNRTPFDHKYNLEDDKSQYCTELVWRAYLHAGIDLSQGRRTQVSFPGLSGTFLLPLDLEKNEALKLIYRF